MARKHHQPFSEGEFSSRHSYPSSYNGCSLSSCALGGMNQACTSSFLLSLCTLPSSPQIQQTKAQYSTQLMCHSGNGLRPACPWWKTKSESFPNVLLQVPLWPLWLLNTRTQQCTLPTRARRAHFGFTQSRFAIFPEYHLDPGLQLQEGLFLLLVPTLC